MDMFLRLAESGPEKASNPPASVARWLSATNTVDPQQVPAPGPARATGRGAVQVTPLLWLYESCRRGPSVRWFRMSVPLESRAAWHSLPPSSLLETANERPKSSL